MVFQQSIDLCDVCAVTPFCENWTSPFTLLVSNSSVSFAAQCRTEVMFTAWLYYRPGQAYIKWHLTRVLHDFCASYIQPSSSTHRSENCHILLVHRYNKLRTNLNILMEQHLPQWWWGLLEHRQIQTSQLSRLQMQVQSTLLLIQVSLCCQSVKDKHLTWGTNSFQSLTNIHKILLLSVHRTHTLFLKSVSIIHIKGMWMYLHWFPSLHVVNQKKGRTLHLIPTYVKSDSMQVVHRN